MKVFIAGEGPDELGGWYAQRSYRDKRPGVGIIEALLRRLATEFDIIDGIDWKSIRKYAAGQFKKGDRSTVVRAALMALEAEADVLIFVRDRDVDFDREARIDEGVADARSAYPEVRVAGGLAVHEVEAWILALKGHRKSESHRDAKNALKEREGIDDREGKIAAVESADFAKIAADAGSLTLWIDRARAALEHR